MFEEIIQYFIDKGEFHERVALNTRQFAKYLEEQTEETKRKLSSVIVSYNYDTIEPTTFNQTKCYPNLEFWRGVDDFGTSVGLNYGGDIDIFDNEELIVHNQYNYEEPTTDEDNLLAKKERKSIKIDIKRFPVSQLGYFNSKSIETAMYYSWLAFLWQEVDGYKCGIKVKTVQNNSIARFSLNDFLQDDFSAYMDDDYGDKPEKLKSFFPRKLSLIELFQRANQTSYPFNPYKNYWRYFEKGDSFMEIVSYDLETVVQIGKLTEQKNTELTDRKSHNDPKTLLKYLTDFTNNALLENWEEKLRPLERPQKIHKEAFDFEFWTGTGWFSNENENRLSSEAVIKFEKQNKLSLPKSLFHYLRIFNGRQNNNHNLWFPIDDLNTVQVSKFYKLDEIKLERKGIFNRKPSEFIWIGELQDNRRLGVSLKSDSFGKVALEDKESISLCDYTFEVFTRFAQSDSVQAEIFAAEENNVEFLQQRIREGWDFNTKYGYSTAIGAAASNNSHNVLSLLLEIGARLGHNNHRSMTWEYDETTMGILDKYAKEKSE